MNKETGLYWPLCNKNIMLKPGETWEMLGVLKMVSRFWQSLTVLCVTQPQQTSSSSMSAYLKYARCLCDCEIMQLLFAIQFCCQVFPDFRIYGVLPGRLTKADRELIVVATSIHNKCLYCVVAHSALHRIYSKKPTLADQVSNVYDFTWCVLLWLPLMLKYQPCDLHVATRSSLTMRMPTCHPESVPCWTLRWQYVAATPSRSSISRLWRNTALTAKMPGTLPPLPLSSQCPIGLHTSPIWDQIWSFITWAVYQGTRAKMVDQWKVTGFLVLLLLAARFVVAVIFFFFFNWDLSWDVLFENIFSIFCVHVNTIILHMIKLNGLMSSADVVHNIWAWSFLRKNHLLSSFPPKLFNCLYLWMSVN